MQNEHTHSKPNDQTLFDTLCKTLWDTFVGHFYRRLFCRTGHCCGTLLLDTLYGILSDTLVGRRYETLIGHSRPFHRILLLWNTFMGYVSL